MKVKNKSLHHPKKCLNCNIDFFGDRKTSEYCSRECSGAAYSKKIRANKPLRFCQICGKQFFSFDLKAKACSYKCSRGLIIKPPKICTVCKKEYKSSSKYCSSKCYGQTMIGLKKGISIWEKMTTEEQLEHLKKSFENRVIKKDGCWDYVGGKSKRYGSIQYQDKSISLQRASWIIYYGPIPEKMYICHTCDNPICSNPDHLFLGTPQDNVIDMIKKGRNNTPKGQSVGSSKLSEYDVHTIKKLLKREESLTEIARKYNVSIGTIHDIKYKKTWAHIKEINELSQ